MDSYAPQNWDEYVGQHELKRRLKVYMDAALATGDPLPHVLLSTHPGMGKTVLTDLIIGYLRDPSFQIDLSTMTANQFISAIRRFPGGVIFFDEVHRATKKQLEQLLTLLEEGHVISPAGAMIEVPWLTAILATTEPEKLPRPLKDRCPIQPEFVDYPDDELAQIIQQMCKANEIQVTEEVAQGLGRACAGTPRLARNMVKAMKALSFQPGMTTLEQVLDLVQVNEDGLSSQHIKYLKALDKLDGLAGAKPLMNVLQLSSTSALEDIERVLFRRDLISYTQRGRCLLPGANDVLRGAKEDYSRVSIR